MRDWRISPEARSLIVGLGLLISLVAVLSAFADAQSASRGAPFDQGDDTGDPNTGFVPYVVPEAGVAAPAVPLAPTLRPPIAVLNDAAPVVPPAPTLRPPIAVLNDATPASPSAPPRPSPSPNLTNAVQTAATSMVPQGAWQETAAGEGPALTATLAPIWLPDRLVIPAIKLDAPVVPAKLKDVEYQGIAYRQWVAPNLFAAGRLATSAPLGVSGNTVLIGHHNSRGEVFAHLADLKLGDLIRVYAGDKEFAYTIVLTMILPERFQSLEVRLKNAQWIEPSQDERLTLVTCWPYASNTHRLIIVATPVSVDGLENLTVTPRLTPLPVLDWKSTPTLAPMEPLPEPSATTSP